jgi:uncharacterized protein (DUF488 family)
MRRAATIGVYGWTLPAFLEALLEAEVRLVMDVRQRRGVRGPAYAWANSFRFQAVLAEAGIDYRHHKELAPTTELRRVQYAEDARRGIGKRSRDVLATEYRERYVSEILARVDLPAVVAHMPLDAVSALLCVERDPEACHRSLVAERLQTEHGIEVTHLLPGPS